MVEQTEAAAIQTKDIVSSYQVALSTVFYKRSGQCISIYVFVSAGRT